MNNIPHNLKAALFWFFLGIMYLVIYAVFPLQTNNALKLALIQPFSPVSVGIGVISGVFVGNRLFQVMFHLDQDNVSWQPSNSALFIFYIMWSFSILTYSPSRAVGVLSRSQSIWEKGIPAFVIAISLTILWTIGANILLIHYRNKRF